MADGSEVGGPPDAGQFSPRALPPRAPWRRKGPDGTDAADGADATQARPVTEVRPIARPAPRSTATLPPDAGQFAPRTLPPRAPWRRKEADGA